MSAVRVRALSPDEWQRFRDFRIAALRAEPGVFAASAADAEKRTEAEWRTTIEGAGNQVFGLFDGEALVGITAVFTLRDDPTGKTALLAMSFIAPAYRGRGLSALFYEARLAWARAHGGFERVIVSHRATNEASRRANQRFGFVRIGVEPRTWPDGAVEDDITYELKL